MACTLISTIPTNHNSLLKCFLMDNPTFLANHLSTKAHRWWSNNFKEIWTLEASKVTMDSKNMASIRVHKLIIKFIWSPITNSTIYKLQSSRVLISSKRCSTLKDGWYRIFKRSWMTSSPHFRKRYSLISRNFLRNKNKKNFFMKEYNATAAWRCR